MTRRIGIAVALGMLAAVSYAQDGQESAAQFAVRQGVFQVRVKEAAPPSEAPREQIPRREHPTAQPSPFPERRDPLLNPFPEPFRPPPAQPRTEQHFFSIACTPLRTS